MELRPYDRLTCPLDGLPLERQGGSWRCARGHAFDQAAQGYVNLLPVQQKRSRDPGDSKEMVAARRSFLNAGHYQPIAAAVSRLTLAERPAGGALNCLDAGCGEGYYLRRLAEAGQAAGPGRLAILGLDISKWAVLAAARQDRFASQGQGLAWVVGSNAHLPVLDGEMDRLLCLFGFPVYEEFARVLKPGGLLLQVDAGPGHLLQLREVIYPSLKPEKPVSLQPPPGFTPAGEETLAYTLALENQEAIASLLAMTPHQHLAGAEGRARAARLNRLEVDVQVRLKLWRRAPLAG